MMLREFNVSRDDSTSTGMEAELETITVKSYTFYGLPERRIRLTPETYSNAFDTGSPSYTRIANNSCLAKTA